MIFISIFYLSVSVRLLGMDNMWNQFNETQRTVSYRSSPSFVMAQHSIM